MSTQVSYTRQLLFYLWSILLTYLLFSWLKKINQVTGLIIFQLTNLFVFFSILIEFNFNIHDFLFYIFSKLKNFLFRHLLDMVFSLVFFSELRDFLFSLSLGLSSSTPHWVRRFFILIVRSSNALCLVEFTSKKGGNRNNISC